MDEAERDRLIAQAAQHHEILVVARYERDERRAAGQDTTWLDDLITGLEQVEANLRDVTLLHAVRGVIERHGPGPWPPDELAAVAGVDAEDLRRVLAHLVNGGLAELPGTPQDNDQ